MLPSSLKYDICQCIIIVLKTYIANTIELTKFDCAFIKKKL